MRRLTFAGFLKNYVKELSFSGSESIFRLCEEASDKNARLREPLLLFAAFGGKQKLLLHAAGKYGLSDFYGDLLFCGAEEWEEKFSKRKAPENYQKVWDSFEVRKNRLQTENETKEWMREKVLRLQKHCRVSNYRLYTDLKINPGNMNDWLKNGTASKISLQTARAAVHYLEERNEKN